LTRSALITGASSGIGEAYAGKLASLGYGLILVARRRDRLEAVAAEMQSKYSVSACVLPCDLSTDEGIALVEDKIKQSADLAVLVNNAGFGTLGNFADVDSRKSLDMIQVHVTAATRLSKAALPGMIARRGGSIINVASVSALMPTAGNAIYSATKSYLVAFSRCLQDEVADCGIRVQALCPGFTRTGFHLVAEFEGIDFSGIPSFMWMSAGQVVEQSWKALGKKKVVFVPGLRNRVVYSLLGPVFALVARKRPLTQKAQE
jgi:short-subunit dehydrogenase